MCFDNSGDKIERDVEVVLSIGPEQVVKVCLMADVVSPMILGYHLVNCSSDTQICCSRILLQPSFIVFMIKNIILIHANNTNNQFII